MNLSRVVRALSEVGVPDAARDAKRLFEWAYAQGANAPEPQDRDRPNDFTLEMFEIAIQDRLKRRPVSQITGQRAFWRHEFDVNGDVLDPRPDTETLVEQALSEPFERVLDLGTGSGCIVISLLADRPAARGLGVDLSEAALRVARRNADRIGVADRLDLQVSDWFGAVEGRFDLIVSNPPYIAASEMPELAPEVREWEPHMALTDGGDGLAAYRAICDGMADHLLPGGLLLVEIGLTQGADVSALMTGAGLDDVHVLPDLNGHDRVVSGRCPG